jgi:hypothetical protein
VAQFAEIEIARKKIKKQLFLFIDNPLTSGSLLPKWQTANNHFFYSSFFNFWLTFSEITGPLSSEISGSLWSEIFSV